MSQWNPSLANLELETLMESQEVDESDRDEVRRFAEFLQRRKDKRDGLAVGPMPNAMRAWLEGK